MSFITETAKRILEREGKRVVSMSDPPDLTEARTMLVAAGAYVEMPGEVPSLDRALGLVRANGYSVFAPRPIPEIGSKWRATRHQVIASKMHMRGWIDGPRDPLDVREVVGVDAHDGPHVTWCLRDDLLNMQRRVTLRTWQEWVTRFRAERVT